MNTEVVHDIAYISQEAINILRRIALGCTDRKVKGDVEGLSAAMDRLKKHLEGRPL